METELSPQTAWQNEGICYRYAEDKLNDCALRSIYMAIVRRSFGYGKKVTDRISQEELAKVSALSSRTLRDKLKVLEQLDMVKIIPPDTMIKGGGSSSCAYAPAYPKGFGAIKFKDDSNNSGSKVESKPTIVTKEPEIVESEFTYVKGKDYDF